MRPSLRVVLLALLVLASGTLASCRRGRRWWRRGGAIVVRPITAAQRAQIAEGREAYVRYCALCHGQNAQGYAADHANALGNPAFLAVATDDFLRAAITDGRPGTPMSAWGREHGGPLDPPTVDRIVAYLRSLARWRRVDAGRIRVASGSVERGQALFAAQCASCHGARAEGTARATSLSNPNFQRTASNGYLRWTIEHGRPGTEMRSFRSLGSAALDDLVATIRTLEAPPPPPIVLPTEPLIPPPGLEALVINPTGRAPRFNLREGRYVPAAEVVRALEEHRRMIILDARATSDWGVAHITGSLPFPFYDIEQLAGRIPRDGTWVIAYCACPHAASGHVVDELRRRHFPHTAVLDEGINYWLQQNYPTVRGEPRH